MMLQKRILHIFQTNLKSTGMSNITINLIKLYQLKIIISYLKKFITLKNNYNLQIYFLERIAK